MPADWSEPTGRITAASDQELGQWWSLFHDPVLDALVSRALSANPDLRIAEARIREARAQRTLVAAGGFPSVDTTGSYSTIRRSENTSAGSGARDIFQLGFDASWEIDLFGRTRRQIEAADAALAASLEDRRDVLVSLIAEVSQNYLNLCANQQRQAIARENIRSQEQTASLVQSKFELGLGTELEVVQTNTLLSLTRAEIPSLESDVALNAHQLAVLLGLQPQEMQKLLPTGRPMPVVPPRLPMVLPSELLRQRPDIRAAERQLASATALVGAAVAELYPRFSLSALVGLQSNTLSDLITAASRYWTLGPVVQWSLFDGGAIRAGIEINESRRDLAQATYEKTVLKALAEAEDALIVLDREQQRRNLLDTSVQSAQKAVTIARGQYKAGLTTFLNVLQGEASLYQSQDKLAQSDLRLSLAMVALYKALGGGWQPTSASSPSVPTPHS